jgi:cytoskeletal protein CcmA (bactofilin family)
MFSSKRKSSAPPPPQQNAAVEAPPPHRRGGRMVPSIISGDLIISGNLLSGGELQVDGTIDGDVRASSLVIGEQATVTGEVLGEEVIIRGRVIGSVRGLRVVLAANCHVEGEIFHESLAVEPGAYFEGNCRRSEDPLSRSEVEPMPPVTSAPSYRQQVPDDDYDQPPVSHGQQHLTHASSAPAPHYEDYDAPDTSPVIVKDGRVVVRRSAAE